MLLLGFMFEAALPAREELLGFSLGLVWNRSSGACLSSATHERCNLVRLLTSFGRMMMGNQRPFAAIQVNKAPARKVHLFSKSAP